MSDLAIYTQAEMDEANEATLTAITAAEDWKRQANEAKQTIQTLLSEKQELKSLTAEQKSLIAEQKKRIAEQAEQIGKLNASDLTVKENEKLRQDNERLKTEKEKAMGKAIKDKNEAAKKEAEAIWKMREAKNLRSNLNDEIRTKAEEMTAEARKQLEKTYRNHTASYNGSLAGALLYGILVTVFTGVNNSFGSAFLTFIGVLWGFIRSVGNGIVFVANKAALLGDMIPQSIIAFLVHWLMLIVVFVGLSGLLLYLLLKLLHFILIQKFCDDFGFDDTVSLWVVFISLAVVVYFADGLASSLPINLILLLILVHVVYVAARWFLENRLLS